MAFEGRAGAAAETLFKLKMTVTRLKIDSSVWDSAKLTLAVAVVSFMPMGLSPPSSV